MISGYLMLAFLTVLAALAALSVSVRSRPEGRAELALCTGILWNFLIALPIYVLGLTHRLTSEMLAPIACLLFMGVLASTFVGPRPKEHAKALALGVWHVLTLPFAGIAEVRRARSLSLVALGLAFGLIAYSFLLSWYAPAWRAWDALWYHEPLVGLAIQEHSLGPYDLPPNLQKVNGYPRLGEMTQLWFVIFTDRRLVDVAQSFMAPVLAVAQYLLCLRYGRDRIASMAWASAMVLMPAGASLLQSTYIDLHVAALELAAAYFALRPRMRLRDGLFAAAALSLAVGAKHMALVPVLCLGFLACVRLIWQNVRGRKLATLGTVLAGLAAIGGMVAAVYLRNLINFKNPFWPELKYDNEAWNIHWPGNYEWTNKVEGVADYNHIDMNLPWSTFLTDLWSPPYSWVRSHYGEVFDYGFPTAWLIWPLGLLAIIGVWVALARGLIGRILRRFGRGVGWSPGPEAWNLAMLSMVAMAMLYSTPALWASRYNIAATGMLAAAIAWLGRRDGWQRFAEGTASLAAVGMAITFFWVSPRWWLTPSELYTLAQKPYPEREVTPAHEIGPNVTLTSGSAVNKDVGLLREKTLGRGAILAYSEYNANYLGYFWNNDYSNRVVFVPAGPSWVHRVEAIGAMWVFVTPGDPVFRELSGKDSGWKNLGPYNVENWGYVFRRDRW